MWDREANLVNLLKAKRRRGGFYHINDPDSFIS